MRFHERQWTTAERVLFALPPMFLFPLPTKVELSGELIRWVDMGPQPAPGEARAAVEEPARLSSAKEAHALRASASTTSP